MTETIDSTTSQAVAAEAAPKKAAKRGGGLNAMLLADLKTLASGLGIAGAGGMKKAQLVEAIRAAQGGSAQAGSAQAAAARPARGADQPTADPQPAPEAKAEQGKTPPGTQKKRDQQGQQTKGQQTKAQQGQGQQGQAQQGQGQGQQGKQNKSQQAQQGQQIQQGQEQQNKNQQGQQNQDQQGDDESGSRRNRRRRGRERVATRAGGRNEPDTTILEDDVLVPAAGILDVLENYAFVRTSGYLPGPDDVYVSLSMVRKYGLRRGDAVVGQVRQPREGERREKFNPMVRIDSVNGTDPEAAKERPEFAAFTPVHPDQRLRLETDPQNITGRLIDLAAPIGKGQRGLIVAPPNAGRTVLLQSIANSISINNPECHLMIVLVDERPEEVTDFQRSVKGEVIASTFDRPAGDHTTIAELAIERAKRLVELGHDVVVLLDSLTKLGRAYSHTAPTSSRVLAGGLDANSLHPPKRLFGAARNVEDGGSLTIVATLLVETDSAADAVIFEEIAGTANLQLRLRREFADKGVYPAIDVPQSGTRRPELLMGEQEVALLAQLRRLGAQHDPREALESLLERLRASQTNIELLMQVQRSTDAAAGGR